METKKLAIVMLALVLAFSTVSATKDYAMGTLTTAGGTGGTPSTPGGAAGGGAGGGGGGAATTETILEQTLSGTISAEDLAAVLTEAGFSTEQIEAAKALIGKAEITQTIKVEKITSASGLISYKTTITITISNPSDMDWKNVKVVIEVPKAVATSASEITSPLSFTTIKEDPIIEFLVDVPTGTSKTLTWSVAKHVSAAVANTIKAPIIVSFREEVPANKCAGVNCDDGNPCTVDSCDAATGTCSHANVADGAVCGAGMVCKAGQCVIPTAAVTGGELLPPWAILLIVIIIIVAAYYFLVMKKQKRKR